MDMNAEGGIGKDNLQILLNTFLSIAERLRHRQQGWRLPSKPAHSEGEKKSLRRKTEAFFILGREAPGLRRASQAGTQA